MVGGGVIGGVGVRSMCVGICIVKMEGKGGVKKMVVFVCLCVCGFISRDGQVKVDVILGNASVFL